VVDDDERLGELTAARLRRLGFAVESVADLESASVRVGAGDRLVVDYGVIADAPAAEVARLIEACRTIVVSGAVSDAARSRALALGAVAYLVKPVEMDELAHLLRAPAAGPQ